jgi:hypothetical protein
LLRSYDQDHALHPIVARFENLGSLSLPLIVRELAMMDVMDKITDKPDWHKKVFDDNIVSKWRKEALAIPDEELFKLATSGKLGSQIERDSNEQETAYEEAYQSSDQIPENILNEETFESVSIYFHV